MALLLGDINQYPELEIFFENIKDMCDKLNRRLKRKKDSQEIQYEFEKFYFCVFDEINEENIKDLAKGLPKSLLNEIALANRMINWFKNIPISNRVFETMEIVLDSIREFSKGKLNAFSIILKELVQLGKILNTQIKTIKNN